MKKILTLFQRNYDGDRLVRNEVTPGCEWVLAGAGEASEKIDGTCCMIRDSKLYKRYELKKGKVAPRDFEAAQEPDPVTGDVPGWVRVTDGSEDQWHREGYDWRLEFFGTTLVDGTYELIGPKIQQNPYNMGIHQLVEHGVISVLRGYTINFDVLRDYLYDHEIEGIVWRDHDGKMAKLKRRDFGFTWPVKHR